MTDAELAKHISLMKAIPRETVHLPIATVERLMATGHKVKVGKGSVKAGKFKPAKNVGPVSRQIGRKAKAIRTERGLLTNRAKASARSILTAEVSAESAGYTAHKRGDTVDDCPHDGRTILARMWKQGYAEAAKEAKKAARANAAKARKA